MLADPATFGRLILSFHKSYSVLSAKIRATNELGILPKIGTREHISELLGVNIRYLVGRTCVRYAFSSHAERV